MNRFSIPYNTVIHLAVLTLLLGVFPQVAYSGAIPFPPIIKAAITANLPLGPKGLATIDGRDHAASGTLLLGPRGTLGLWTTTVIQLAGAPKIGGTAGGISYPPTFPPNPAIALSNQIDPTIYPTTPDNALGGPPVGFMPGTLKSIAQSGVLGSRYLTTIAIPGVSFSGVTFLEPADSINTLSGAFSGGGILVVHNVAGTARLNISSSNGTFSGIIIADRLTLAGTPVLTGAVVLIGSETSSLQIGGVGAPTVLYSSEAVNNALTPLAPLITPCVTVQPSLLPPAQAGIPYTQALTAIGGAATYAFTGFDLPGWLSLSADGILSGTPPGVRRDSFTIRVDDLAICSVTMGFSLTVDSASLLTGRLTWDANKNGAADPGEPGLSDRRIRIQGLSADSALTGADGRYAFAGMPWGSYLVREDPRTSWSQSFPKSLGSAQPDSLMLSTSAELFRHLSRLARDAALYRSTPLALGGGGGSYAGYTVPGSLANDPWATYTGTVLGPSSVRFTASSYLPPGQFIVYVDSGGYVTSQSGFDGSFSLVTLSPTERAATGREFGEVPYEIVGTVSSRYRDRTTALAGWRVDLHGPIDTFAITDVNGTFLFRDFPWGRYSVSEQLPPGWDQASPPLLTTHDDQTASTTLRIETRLYEIAGTAFRYRETATAFGGGGGTYAGYSIAPELLSDSSASYQVADASTNVLRLRATLLSGGEMIEFTVDSTGRVSVTLTGNLYARPSPGSFFFSLQSPWDGSGVASTRADFGNTERTAVSGMIFNDLNLDGVRQPQEEGIPNARLFIAGQTVDSVLTDSTGRFRFSNLPAGPALVNEGFREGLRGVTPSDAPLQPARDTLIRVLNELVRHLFVLAADASRYRQLPSSFGGGGGSFIGYLIPAHLASTPHGGYGVRPLDSLVVTATSTDGYGTVQGVADASGFVALLPCTGEFTALSPRLVDTDHSSLGAGNVEFGNAVVQDTITASASVGGTIVPSGNVLVPFGSNAFFVTRPDSGYHVDSIIVDGTYKGALTDYTFSNVRERHAITATFAVTTHTVVASARAHGRVTPAGRIGIIHGTRPVFSFTPDAGYAVDSVVVDGVAADSLAQYTFPPVTADHELWVSFRLASVPVSFAVREGWNMVALPVLPPDARKRTLFSSAVSPAFAYGGSYAIEESLRWGAGYWIRFPAPETLSIVGLPLEADSIALHFGWNLIGPAAASSMPVGAFGAAPSSILLSDYFGYELRYKTVQTLEPGRAYWVKASGEGILIRGTRSRAGRLISASEPPPPPEQEEALVPTEIRLEEAYPNPFNPLTTIRYALPTESSVRLLVVDLLGRVVATLVDAVEAEGYKEARWSASGFGSGVYFCRLEVIPVADPSTLSVKTRKVLLVK